jgi:hypothetical protein
MEIAGADDRENRQRGVARCGVEWRKTPDSKNTEREQRKSGQRFRRTHEDRRYYEPARAKTTYHARAGCLDGHGIGTTPALDGGRLRSVPYVARFDDENDVFGHVRRVIANAFEMPRHQDELNARLNRGSLRFSVSSSASK